ncbi:CbtA family protein [Mycolicibacterium flavescens]|uniref:Cobalt transporter n=1 Tax=Mycolicibacterium flavescens TaxID=1776 RepID=A0A1E3RLZ8_MYCFV|nr:CbtA family protein [Mycolicibacterium flavescens]MCV7281709.1 CbtA family protein [Mycolicibacterium flavescens]ODQ90889.1 cobalt transporter [Mycolicibacterium flavescens]
MPLNSVVRYLLPGFVAGVVAFVFSRVMIAPLIAAAIDYEGEREHAEEHLGGGHAHGHELFTCSVQENLGAATGIIAFGVIMGVLFAVVHGVLPTVLERRGFRPDPAALALLSAAGMFVTVALMPGLKYPANPPSVGLDETVPERSSAFLTITALSVVGAAVAVGVGLAWARRWGAWRAGAAAVGGYLVVMVGAMALLPSFHEVPGPVSGPAGLLLDGFPAEVLADFRVYSLVNQAIVWAVIGVITAVIVSRRGAREHELERVG